MRRNGVAGVSWGTAPRLRNDIRLQADMRPARATLIALRGTADGFDFGQNKSVEHSELVNLGQNYSFNHSESSYDNPDHCCSAIDLNCWRR